MNNRDLQAAFDFEPPDLAANRSGDLSTAQWEKIAAEYKKSNGDKLQTGAFFVVFSTLFVFATVTLLASLGWLVALFAMVAILFYFLAYSNLRGASFATPAKYAASLAIQKAQRPASFPKDPDGGTLLSIGSEQFPVDAYMEDDLGKGGNYAAYFYQAKEDGESTLLSIEALPGH